MFDDSSERIPTLQECIEFQVRQEGHEKPSQEWFLSDYDTWHRNPSYQGEPGPHPEDGNREGDLAAALAVMLTDAGIRGYLDTHDPKAVKQAIRALGHDPQPAPEDPFGEHDFYLDQNWDDGDWVGFERPGDY